MNLYGRFILGVNIKYIVFSIFGRHICVPKELIIITEEIKFPPSIIIKETQQSC